MLMLGVLGVVKKKLYGCSKQQQDEIVKLCEQMRVVLAVLCAVRYDDGALTMICFRFWDLLSGAVPWHLLGEGPICSLAAPEKTESRDTLSCFCCGLWLVARLIMTCVAQTAPTMENLGNMKQDYITSTSITRTYTSIAPYTLLMVSCHLTSERHPCILLFFLSFSPSLLFPSSPFPVCLLHFEKPACDPIIRQTKKVS